MMEASGRVIIGAIQSYFGAAIGLQRLPNRAVREPPLAGQEYAAHCSGDAAEGSFPVFAALRRLPEEPTLDQSLLILIKKRPTGEAHREIKSALRVIPSIFVSA